MSSNSHGSRRSLSFDVVASVGNGGRYDTARYSLPAEGVYRLHTNGGDGFDPHRCDGYGSGGDGFARLGD